MSGKLITDNPARIFAFVRKYTPVNMTAGMQALGWEKDGELVAGVLYEGFNNHNVWMHVAADPDKNWLTRAFLHAAFIYPFEQLNCVRVSGYVEASNSYAIKFDEHLGFKREALLEGAASDGGDVIVYRMWKHECRYIPRKKGE